MQKSILVALICGMLLFSGCTMPWSEEEDTTGMCTAGDENGDGDNSCEIFDEVVESENNETDVLPLLPGFGDSNGTSNDTSNPSSPNDDANVTWEGIQTETPVFWRCTTYVQESALGNNTSNENIQSNFELATIPEWCDTLVDPSVIVSNLSGDDLTGGETIYRPYGYNSLAMSYDLDMNLTMDVSGSTNETCSGSFDDSDSSCSIILEMTTFDVGPEYAFMVDENSQQAIWRYNITDDYVIIGSITEITYGSAQGMYAANFEGLIHQQNASQWDNFSFDSLFNLSWNQQEDAGEKWVVVFFLSTDCGHCWNAGDDLSQWHEMYGNETTFLAMAVNFSSSNSFNASPEEVVAFQEKTNYVGCRGGTYDCVERPGDVHNFSYFDDRNQSVMYSWGVTGTPAYFILSPDGQFVWNQYQHRSSNGGDGETIEDALLRLFG
tara:strand:- start:603 stop:1913 length:1311 start_codon:yes stop_codon:yes gene_type:complete